MKAMLFVLLFLNLVELALLVYLAKRESIVINLGQGEKPPAP